MAVDSADHIQINSKIEFKPYGRRGPWVTAVGKDISGSGMKIMAKQPVAVNTKIHMQVHFSDNDSPVRAMGTVTLCEHPAAGDWQVGLTFTKIQDRDHFAQSFCEKLLEANLPNLVREVCNGNSK